jgi:NTP pyrophosphatase (non-canonical NTP hydrolase)
MNPHPIADAATDAEKSAAFEWLRGMALGTPAAIADQRGRRLAGLALDEWSACKERLTESGKTENSAHAELIEIHAAVMNPQAVEIRPGDCYTTKLVKEFCLASLGRELTFADFRRANVARCIKWHPLGIASWSPSDWLTAVTGELGELASLLKMRNRERDQLPGNKFSPTDKQIAAELADVLTYLDLLAAVLGIDLGRATVEKFNEVSARVGFPDRIALPQPAERIA